MRRRRAAAVGLGLALCACLVAERAAAAAVAVQPTRGSMLFETSDPKKPLAELPLEKTDVRARILGYVARVEVRQTFNNPFDQSLEAIYVFPLPDDAAIGEMSIQVGDRTIRGVVKTRAQAKALYEKAKREGRIAALLDQERPNIFTQSVANIEPKGEVRVQIRYDVPLDLENGAFQFTYPMVVGPRYVPGAKVGKRGSGRAPDTDEVPDGSRITPPIRKPGSRAGHDVTMQVTVDPGTKIAKLWSPTHAIDVDQDRELGPTAFRVSLRKGDRVPNKDFVLRYRLAGSGPAVSLMAQKGGAQGYFALLLSPPAAAESFASPVELVLVLDASSRMTGEPMALAKRAVRHILRNLEPEDAFRMIRFSDRASALSEQPKTPTSRNVRQALSWLNGIAPSGGTEIRQGLRAAFHPEPGADRRRVVVLVSNGNAGNEAAVLDEIDKHMDAKTRLFAFGPGSSPNRYLLERAAELGRGAAHYALLTESPEKAAQALYQQLRAPVLTDVAIDWRGMKVSDVIPGRVPDLWAGRPISVVGRFAGKGRKAIRVRGKLAGEPVSYRVAITDAPVGPTFTGADAGGPGQTARGAAGGAIARLWARARVRALMMSRAGGGAKRAAEVEAIGLRHGLVTSYTSFVAVGTRVVTEDGERKEFVIPVEMPEGMSYEGVFRTTLGRTSTHERDEGGDSRVGVGGAGADGVEGELAEPGPPTVDESFDDDGPMPGSATAQRSVATTSADMEAIMVERGRRWIFGAGVAGGLGLGAGDDSGAITGVDLRAMRLVTRDVSVGAEVGLRVPLFETDDDVWSNLLVEAGWAGLWSGRLQILGGAGGALLSGGELGLSYMGALELRLPFGPAFGAGLQLRLDGTLVPEREAGDDLLQSYTLGVRFSF